MDHSFETVLNEQLSRYPLMDVQDCAKLAFQSEYGPEHIIDSAEKAEAWVLTELRESGGSKENALPERISEKICRYPLAALSSENEARILSRLMVMTAQDCKGSPEGLAGKIQVIARTGLPEAREWTERWCESGCPAIHHSEAFRKAYSPHYRLLRAEYAGFIESLAAIDELARKKDRVCIAVEGKCGAGKTFFAETAKKLFDCNIIHIDDFYLPLNQRKEDWEHIPAGNMDFDRFNYEVAAALRSGSKIAYRPYICSKKALGQAVELSPKRLTIVEGSYCRHPEVGLDYDLRLYLTCSPQARLSRLKEREGDYFPMFQQRWIPAEERYNSLFNIENTSDYIVDTE